MEWTDERIKILREMYGKPKISTNDIAVVLGCDCTKNMVIGKAGRLGLSKPRPSKNPQVPSRPRLINSSQHCVPIIRTTKVSAGLALIKISRKSSKFGNPCHIFDLSEHSCRFPLGEIAERAELFCNARSAEGYPYCQPHCDIAYQKATK